jgi:cell division inhibitor SepF
MGFADVWNRTLVYFGIAEEDDEWDEDGYVTEEELERTYSARPNVRRLAPRSRRQEFDDWTDPDAETDVARTAVVRPTRRRERRGEVEQLPRPTPVPSVRVHLVVPHTFQDAQQIADRFKEGIPVILNLQGADQELSKRLIDFTSGLTYALDGGMQRVADKVFLLTPRNVEVSAEERARLLESGGFFNQA